MNLFQYSAAVLVGSKIIQGVSGDFTHLRSLEHAWFQFLLDENLDWLVVVQIPMVISIFVQ